MNKQAKSGNGLRKIAIISLVLGMMAIGTIGIFIDDIDFSINPKNNNVNSVGINPTTRASNSSLNETTIFEDDFEDGNYNGWETQHATIQNGSFTNGSYILQLHAENNTDGIASYDPVEGWINYTFEATFELGDSFNSWADVRVAFYDEYSVHFDVKNDVISLDYYSFNTTSWITTKSTSFDIKANEPYTIKIVTVLQNAEVFVNDVKVLTDDIIEWGVQESGFAFVAHTSDSGWFKLNIDNVKITETEVPEVIPVVGSVLFEDDFEDGNFNGWDTTSTAYIQNSSMGGGNFALQLHLHNYMNQTYNGTAVVSSGYNWSNYQVEADIILNDVRADLMFYVQVGSTNYFPKGYGVVLDPVNDKIAIEKYSYWGSWINSTDYPLSIGQEYNISVKVYNNLFQVFIDGNMVLIGEDSLYASGSIGVLTYGWGPTINSCTFDNVKVTQLEALGTSSSLTVIADKESYQPGDSVSLTATYSGANSTNCHFLVEYPDGSELASQTKVVQATGNVSFSFNLPIDTQTGVYTVYATTYDASAQIVFGIAISNFGIVSISVTDIKVGSPLYTNVTVENQMNHGQQFVLVIQIIDSNGVPLQPFIKKDNLLLAGQTYTQTVLFTQITSDMPTGVYHVQAQLLTALPSEGGYALDFMDTTVTISEA